MLSPKGGWPPHNGSILRKHRLHLSLQGTRNRFQGQHRRLVPCLLSLSPLSKLVQRQIAFADHDCPTLNPSPWPMEPLSGGRPASLHGLLWVLLQGTLHHQ